MCPAERPAAEVPRAPGTSYRHTDSKTPEVLDDVPGPARRGSSRNGAGPSAGEPGENAALRNRAHCGRI